VAGRLGDGAARLAGFGPTARKAGLDPVEVVRTTAEALRSIVRTPLVKGEVSAAVTAAVPDGYSYECRGCKAFHIQEQLLRVACLPAGLAIEPGTSPPVLRPLARWRRLPARAKGPAALVRAYLRVLGPAKPADVAGYLQASLAAIKQHWPADAVEVRVDGRPAWIAEEHLADLQAAPEPRVVRLLPRSDPWLQARDRALIVPDKARQRALWPVIGQPGALLVDGEVIGAWRTRASGKRLVVKVQPFGRLAAATRRAVEEEAAVVAAVRGQADVSVTFEP
jgi:hypothetical protein